LFNFGAATAEAVTTEEPPKENVVEIKNIE